ncbi:MAG: GCN5-related N-acetyltransferase [Alphaproteobacteria bacterium]|jgi:GNAT superfamily N-acetyltransferase|nr:GCN5-related N-acetyltransferase [Alphaproteobacteria bacterium]
MANIRRARLSEVLDIYKLRKDAADELTRKFGKGPWSKISLLNTVLHKLTDNTLFVVIDDGKLAGTFTLDVEKTDRESKPWFKRQSAPACYLRNMSIDPKFQGKGLGRAALYEIENRAVKLRVRAVRLDAFVGPGGAAEFYRKCGYTFVHRGKLGKTDLEYFEKVLS